MKLELCIGILCITIMIVTALALGHDGAMVASGLAIVGGLLGWQGKKLKDKRGNNIDALIASLKKASFSDDMIMGVIQTIKRRK